MTSTEGRDLLSNEYVNVYVDNVLTANTVVIEALQIPNGAANGFILTSDANGVATWQGLLNPQVVSVPISYNGAWSNATVNTQVNTTLTFYKSGSLVEVAIPFAGANISVANATAGSITSNTFSLPDVTWLPNTQVYGNSGSFGALFSLWPVINASNTEVSNLEFVWVVGSATGMRIAFNTFTDPANNFFGNTLNTQTAVIAGTLSYIVA